MLCVILSEIRRARVGFFPPKGILGAGRTLKSSVRNSYFDLIFFSVLSFLFAITNCYWNTNSWYRLGEIFHLSNAATAQSLANAQTRSWFTSKQLNTFLVTWFSISVSDIFSMQVNYYAQQMRCSLKICLEKAVQWCYWLVWIWFSLAERGGFSHRPKPACVLEIILWRKNWRLTQYLGQWTRWNKPPFKVFITVSSDRLPSQEEIAHTCS